MPAGKSDSGGRPPAADDSEYIDVLARNGPLPTSAVAEAVGVSKMTAHRHLNQLLDAGEVSRAFAVQTAVWSVADGGADE